MNGWEPIEQFRAEEARFARWDAHWTLVYERLHQGCLAFGAVTMGAPLFGEPRVSLAALWTQILTYLAWRAVARHRFRGWDRWTERLRKAAE